MVKAITFYVLLVFMISCKETSSFTNQKLEQKKNDGNQTLAKDTFPITTRHDQLDNNNLSKQDVIQTIDGFVFGNDDVKFDYEPYMGSIDKSEVNGYKYGFKTIRLVDVEKSYYQIFEKGLLYPSILDCTECTVKNWETSLQRPNVHNIKRFKFKLTDLANNEDYTYLVKLENSEGTAEMPIDEFLENARLVFLKDVPKEKYERALSDWKDN